MAAEKTILVSTLSGIVGSRHVLTDRQVMRAYCTGFRFGAGSALAVVLPQSLVQLWRVVKACVDADAIVIMQAANTGLTGGSTPSGEGYDRDVIVVNAMAIDVIHVIEGGHQVICLPGARLDALEAKLAPYGREPHSVIGSSCIGASVMGGICNNSGGALVRRGPAFTELALYAQLGDDGVLRLVNHLGIRLEGEPERILDRLDRGAFASEDILPAPGRASDVEYQQHVRAIDAPEPARFNADPRRLFEASGSAGKLIVFAARLDTFPKDERTATFYLGTNDPDEFTKIRRHMLGTFESLPVSAEYMHRGAFDLAETYGKDLFLAIRLMGTRRLPALFRIKAIVSAFLERVGLAPGCCDRMLQRLGRCWPSHLPVRMKLWRDRFDHHLLLKVAGRDIERTRAYLGSFFPSESGDVFECHEEEAEQAFLHRFVTAGAAIRYRLMHGRDVEDIVALDIALPRNARQWVEHLPPAIDEQILHRIYYGHFFCHVFHQDYIVRKGRDPVALEHAMWQLLDARGAEYPAEHNVGHLYPAKPALARFYQSLDPCNAFNPGIGQTPKSARWGGGC